MVTPCGDGGLFTAGWLRLMYLWSWGAGMGRATLRNIMLILRLYVSVNILRAGMLLVFYSSSVDIWLVEKHVGLVHKVAGKGTYAYMSTYTF